MAESNPEQQPLKVENKSNIKPTKITDYSDAWVTLKVREGKLSLMSYDLHHCRVGI